MSLLLVALILTLVGVAAGVGWRYGLVAVGTSFLALLFGVALAAFGYRWLGGLIAEPLGLEVSVAAILSYVTLVVTGQFMALIGGVWLVQRLPKEAVASRFNHGGGAVLAAVQMTVLIAIGLGVASNSGLPSSWRQAVDQAPLVSTLTDLGERLQGVTRFTPGQEVTDTIGLLTIDPESERVVMLGYTTTKVTVDVGAETQILQLVNAERAARGLPTLQPHPEAQAVAREHSRDMFARGYFSHRSLDGRSPFDRMRAGGVSFAAAGENLALAPTVEQAHRGLMDSPGHRANILSPAYGRVGIGVVDGGRYGLMVTQNFTD